MHYDFPLHGGAWAEKVLEQYVKVLELVFQIVGMGCVQISDQIDCGCRRHQFQSGYIAVSGVYIGNKEKCVTVDTALTAGLLYGFLPEPQLHAKTVDDGKQSIVGADEVGHFHILSHCPVFSTNIAIPSGKDRHPGLAQVRVSVTFQTYE